VCVCWRTCVCSVWCMCLVVCTCECTWLRVSVCVPLFLRASVLACLSDGSCTHALSAVGDCKVFDLSIAIHVSKNNKDKPGAECSAKKRNESTIPQSHRDFEFDGIFFIQVWGSQYSNRPRGVTVSTLDSESSDRGSNPREAFLFDPAVVTVQKISFACTAQGNSCLVSSRLVHPAVATKAHTGD
jgi:hypothetical protein